MVSQEQECEGEVLSIFPEATVVGVNEPLIRLFVACATETSILRWQQITNSGIPEMLDQSGAMLLITDSLGYGMSIPESDFDLVFFLRDGTYRESQQTERQLRSLIHNSFPDLRIQIHQVTNVEEVAKTLRFLGEHPKSDTDDLVEAIGFNHCPLQDLYGDYLHGGILIGGNLHNLIQQIEELSDRSPLTKKIVSEARRGTIEYYFNWRKHLYRSRLRGSSRFQTLPATAQEEIFAEIKTLETIMMEIP